MLRALVERRIGRRDQANAWIWRLAEYTRDVHEEYAVQRWPETKRLLGLLVNSAGGAHARNARRLVHAARKQDRGSRRRCSRQRSRTRPRPRRLCAERARGWRASRLRSRASCCATSPSAARATRGVGAKGAEAKPTARAPNGERRRALSAPSSRRWRGQPRPADDLARHARGARARCHARPRRREARARRPSDALRQPIRSRCTSPAPIAACPPPSSATTRRPSPSIPCARPRPPLQLHLPPAQRVARAPRRERLRRAGCASRVERRASAARAPARRRRRAARASRRVVQLRRQVLEANRDVDADAEHRPALLRAPLREDARELREAARRAPSTMSFGHLICACSPATSQTASAASSGSSGGGERSTSDISSALPAGADQRRPWRPRPAVCSAAVTSVPCGAPASASSRARSLVESVRRRCTRGRPSVGCRARGGSSRAERPRLSAPSRCVGEQRLQQAVDVVLRPPRRQPSGRVRAASRW